MTALFKKTSPFSLWEWDKKGNIECTNLEEIMNTTLCETCIEKDEKIDMFEINTQALKKEIISLTLTVEELNIKLRQLRDAE